MRAVFLLIRNIYYLIIQCTEIEVRRSNSRKYSICSVLSTLSKKIDNSFEDGQQKQQNQNTISILPKF